MLRFRNRYYETCVPFVRLTKLREIHRNWQKEKCNMNFVAELSNENCSKKQKLMGVYKKQ